MTSETTSDNELASPEDDDFSIYEVAGRIDLYIKRISRYFNAFDEAAKRLAKTLFETIWVHALYGLLDGLSLSYSTIKYCFDLALTNSVLSSTDIMHDWMLSVDGAIIVGVMTFVLMAYAMLANCFSDSDEQAFKRYIALSWPFLRDSLKGLKNAYKGIRSTFQVIKLLGDASLVMQLVIPVSLFLGGLAVLNHIWNRAMINERKAMMKANAAWIADILNEEFLTEERIKEIHSKIGRQTLKTRSLAMGSAAYSASIYGLYLYMGVLTICPFAPPAMIAMTVFCGIYFLANLAGRLYEEYDNQRKLNYAAVKVELVLLIKQIQQAYTELARLKAMRDFDAANYSAQLERIRALEALFRMKKKEYVVLSYPSLTESLLNGVKHGLAAYSAISGVLFAVATILILSSSMAFPPGFVIACIACISSGILFLASFMIFNAVKTHNQRKQAEAQLRDENFLQVFVPTDEMQTQDELIDEIITMEPKAIENRILTGLERDALPQFLFQEWFEFIRSCFSSAGKGSKAVDYLFNFMQQRDADGHVHDSKIMLWITLGSVLIHCFVLGVRAFAKGIGKLASLEVDLKPQPVEEEVGADQPIEPTLHQAPAMPVELYSDSDESEKGLDAEEEDMSFDESISPLNSPVPVLVFPRQLLRVSSSPDTFFNVKVSSTDELPSQPSPMEVAVLTPLSESEPEPVPSGLRRSRSSPDFFRNLPLPLVIQPVINDNQLIATY